MIALYKVRYLQMTLSYSIPLKVTTDKLCAGFRIEGKLVPSKQKSVT